jgi:hypothetical protein
MQAIIITVCSGAVLALIIWIGSLIKSGGKKIIKAVKHSETGEGCPYSQEITKMSESVDELKLLVKDTLFANLDRMEKKNDLTKLKVDVINVRFGAMRAAIIKGNGLVAEEYKIREKEGFAELNLERSEENLNPITAKF